MRQATGAAHGTSWHNLFLFQTRFEILRFAAALAPLTGLILEFGVASGATITCLAETEQLSYRKIYGFDWFQGLPERWGSYPIGHFACTPPTVPANVTPTLRARRLFATFPAPPRVNE